MLLPRPGDLYINPITKAEYIVDAIITAGPSSVDKEEYIVFHNVDSPTAKRQLEARAFDTELDFVRSTD